MFKLFQKKEKALDLKAPMTGALLTLEQVEDPVFSAKMLGDGFAVEPVEGRVTAPCRATVAQIFPTNHAVGLQTESGIEILIHVGIDTVEMKGEGFTRCVEPGAVVEAGTVLLEVDLDAIRASGRKATTPIVITNMDRVSEIRLNGSKNLKAGESEAVRILLKA